MTSEGAGSDLATLLQLQDVDTAVTQLLHRKASLPARQELADAQAALAGVDRRSAELGAERATLAEQQSSLETRIASASARRQTLEQRMYAARGLAARDLQAMDEEIHQLQHRNEEMEDAELEVMVAIEPLDAALAELTSERDRLRSTVASLSETVAASEAEIDAELVEQRSERDRVAASLSADLLQRYETLRSRLGGTGAARLVGNRCGGCHLELPSMEVDRIHRLPPGSIVTCEQCGRILVPVGSAGDPT